MGNWFSKNKTKVVKIANACTDEEKALKQLLAFANTVKTQDEIRDFYLKSVEYVECNSVNAALLKEQIFNYYQDAIIEEATKLTISYKDWVLLGDTDEEKLVNIQARMSDLQKDVMELNEALKYYTRDDTQGADLLKEIQDLQASTLEQLKEISEAIDVFKARYLFGTIVCNYCCGDIGNANSEAELRIINNYLTLNSYKGCLMFSEFQPLLWPTDFDWDDNNTSQKPVTDEFLTKYLESGIPSENLKNLSNYYSNYFFVKYEAFNSSKPSEEFTNNTFSIPYPNATETFREMATKIKEFVEDVKIRKWIQFYPRGKEVLQKFDVHHFKMLPYMAHKKHLLSNGEFMRIPETYPRYDHDIELLEAVMAIMNVCFANCGTRENSNSSKIIGGYTYNDLNLNKYYSTYFDSRAFILSDEYTVEPSTKGLVTAGNVDTSAWDNVKFVISANKTAEIGANSTGYFSDRIYNCLDDSKNVKASSEFPSIDGLSAVRVVSESNAIAVKTDEDDGNAEGVENNDTDKAEDDKADKAENNDKTEDDKAEGVETFDVSKLVTIEPGVNNMILDFFNKVIKLPATSVLYASNNHKLYSSVDYMTMDADAYSENPAVPYYIYFNLVPKSLSFEIMIPLNTTHSTMSICTNDVRNGCDEKYLIPLAFVGPVDDSGLINDPLFNITNLDLNEPDEPEQDEDETPEEGEGDEPEEGEEGEQNKPEQDKTPETPAQSEAVNKVESFRRKFNI